MTDWEWKRDHVKKGRDLFAKASELRTLDQAIEWEIKAEGWWRVAEREVEDRHPEDINLIEPVGVIPFISMRPENPLYTLAPANLTRGSTSEGSLANTPASRLAARIASLDKLDWPKSVTTPTRRERRVHDKPFKERCADWAYEMLRQPKRTNRDVAEEIGAKQGIKTETVLRGAREARARKAREGRGKAG